MAAEFSHRVKLEKLAAAPSPHRLEAGPEARARLAERFGLLALDRLEAELDVRRTAAGVEAAGRVRAEATQACVVSGAPVPASIDEAVSLRFVPAPEADELELSEEDLDSIPYYGDSIDLGEAAAESVALALEPYPRADEATLAAARARLLSEEEAEALLDAERRAKSPFAALRPN